eukprot:36004-Amphidinium_carterae.1
MTARLDDGATLFLQLLRYPHIDLFYNFWVQPVEEHATDKKKTTNGLLSCSLMSSCVGGPRAVQGSPGCSGQRSRGSGHARVHRLEDPADSPRWQ